MSLSEQACHSNGTQWTKDMCAAERVAPSRRGMDPIALCRWVSREWLPRKLCRAVRAAGMPAATEQQLAVVLRVRAQGPRLSRDKLITQR
eukprot:6181448-Pleurochrysis_carterae.AAC.1